MRRSVVFSLMLMLLLSSSTRGFHGSELLKVPRSSLSNQIFKSYLPPAPQPRYVLASTLDGTISMVDTVLNKVMWSFHSGEPIYSSYQAPHYHDGKKANAIELGDDFYLDCGNDWHLYNHTMRQGKCIRTERMDAREFIGNSPYTLKDRVILGRKDTAVFLLDGKTGRLIKTYRFDDLNSYSRFSDAEEKAIVLANDAAALSAFNPLESEPQNLIFIKRKDYKLQCKSQSGDILWNVAFAEIEAEYQCQRGTEFLGEESSTDTELSTSYVGSNKFQLPCKTSAPVILFRNYSYDELFSRLDGLDGPFYLHFQDYKLPLGPGDRVSLALPDSVEPGILLLPPAETENAGIVKMLSGNVTEMDSTRKSPKVITMSLISLFIGVLSGMFAFLRLGQGRLSKQPNENNVPAVTTKKRKPKKSGNFKNKVHNGKVPIENEFGESKDLPLAEGNERKSLLSFPHLVSGQADGRRIGKLLVSNKEIAKGSSGTVVLEGVYDGRPVAVKRLVQTHHDVALKEIQNLIASDQHPNIVRWYGVEFDKDFIYLSLERCTCSLYDFISAFSGSLESQMASSDGSTVQLSPTMKNDKDIKLWKENGHPSPQLLKLMRDVVSGLTHLHELGIIHRDLKPQNVLIIKDKFLCAKLSDMGISKRLLGDTTSLTRNATGSGSSGWQAPEQLRNGRQTRAVDIFSLGCVLYFCMTGGKHPYGECFERDINILNDRKDLFLLEGIPEAVDLLLSLLDPIPDRRPKAQDVLQHPLFWTPNTRLSFLRDASDRVELENRENGSELLAALEATASVALNGKWDEKLDTVFLENIGRYRRYKFDSVRDLLRVIRNKLNHYRELPQEIQDLLGSVPEGFDNYFSSRYPQLLIMVYKVFCKYCIEEGFFQKYTKMNLL